MRFLYLFTRIVVFKCQVQSDQSKRKGYWFYGCSCMLSHICINSELVHEIYIVKRQCISSELPIQLPARGGSIIAVIELFFCPRQSQTTTWTHHSFAHRRYSIIEGSKVQSTLVS